MDLNSGPGCLPRKPQPAPLTHIIPPNRPRCNAFLRAGGGFFPRRYCATSSIVSALYPASDTILRISASASGSFKCT